MTFTIGFDGKRAAYNRTGLGNYSRFIVQSLSRFSRVDRLLLYVPPSRRPSALNGLEQERGVEVVKPTSRLWRWLSGVWRTWGITRRLRSDGVNLYHGLSGELPLNIGSLSSVAKVVTIHDLIFLRFPQYYNRIDRWIYTYKFRRACQNADRIVAVSECTKRDIIHFFGTPEEKIDVVYQGCDDAFRQRVPDEVKAKVKQLYNLPDRFILYVGSVEERKNLGLLTAAVSRLDDEALYPRHEDITIIAVGRRTPYADKVEQYLHEAGLSHLLRIIEGVSFAHLPAFYQLATVFVYPSRYEGFGIPMLEAISSGVPAIGCTGSCLEEAGGPQSLYVANDDPHELASHIYRVLRDPALRRHMIAAGQAYSDRFLPERLLQDLLATYSKTMAPSALPGK